MLKGVGGENQALVQLQVTAAFLPPEPRHTLHEYHHAVAAITLLDNQVRKAVPII